MSASKEREGRKRKLSAKKRECDEPVSAASPVKKKGKDCDRRYCQEVYTHIRPSCFCRATDK